jgi:hypothetical protein
MKILAAPSNFDFTQSKSDLNVVIFGQARVKGEGSSSVAVKLSPDSKRTATILEYVKKKELCPSPKAWDFLAIALAVVSADLAGHRRQSPDGWTRRFEMEVAVSDCDFWEKNTSLINQLLAFLTTDIWSFKFISGGYAYSVESETKYLKGDCVALLSGGVDSLVGAIDLVTKGEHPIAVSQVVRGDANKQSEFAKALGLNSFQVNHNTRVPNAERPPSQRSRSIIFLAYGIFVATTLEKYSKGEITPLYVCENGFISINPPLTPARIGSLSTRTTHPVVFSLLQDILDNAGLKVKIINPYRFKTKGEMLSECLDQSMLKRLVFKATSCGRFGTYNYKHCGRCVPCLVRRAAFNKWGITDTTPYKHDNLSINDDKHSGFDDVRSMRVGVNECDELGTERWLGASLSSARIFEKEKLKKMISSSMIELDAFMIKNEIK